MNISEICFFILYCLIFAVSLLAEKEDVVSLHVIESLLFGNVPLEGRESYSSHGLHRCVVFCFVLVFSFVCLKLTKGGKGIAKLLAAGLELDHCPQRHRGLCLFEVSSLLGVGKDLLLHVHCKLLNSGLG